MITFQWQYYWNYKLVLNVYACLTVKTECSLFCFPNTFRYTYLDFDLTAYSQSSWKSTPFLHQNFCFYSVSFEDKFKANLERGNAELEKRRLAMQEVERRERERHEQKEREEREKREKEAREAEERRRKEEERRLERQKEVERQIEEELQREMERKEVRDCRYCIYKYKLCMNTPSFIVTAECHVFTRQCPVSVPSRLHSGSSSVRGRRSGRGGGAESSR